MQRGNTHRKREMDKLRFLGIGIMAMAVSLGWSGCAAIRKADVSKLNDFDTLRIVTWNVQALFDGQESGTEYDDYRISTGWTAEKYEARLTALSQALGQIPGKIPDILCLMEIENLQVLESLVKGALSKQGYNWMFFGSNPGAALGIGIISRFPFEQTIMHSITCNGETVPRPVLEARIQIQDKPLVFFVCHWKSKREGAGNTEASRRASARIIQRRLRELNLENPALPVIIAGDLNENHDEFYRSNGLAISALMPDVPTAAELADFSLAADFLVLTHKKPPESDYFAAEIGVLYSPWDHELQDGSYHYKNA
jgi:endonuclease/exonuclease/phosphatase family metal-dependent hydrolase